jgi:hypothetical protein
MINKFQAVHALVGSQITGGENLSEYIFHDGQTPPTEEAVQAKLIELQADYDSKQYQRDRAVAYPSIQEQLDMQYWDAVNGTNKWQEAVAKVKADNPKPE